MSKSLDRIRHATPGELRRAADVDLWRGGASGLDARFDADRFGEWLETLLDAGDGVTARQLAAMDPDLVVVGIAEHVRVFDGAARSVDPGRADVEVGGYSVVAREGRSCQAVLDTLATLHEEAPRFFHRVMRACVRLSNEGYELDGLHDLKTERDQAMADLRLAREERRERQGFLSAADARAFLAASHEGRTALFRAHVRDTADADATAGEVPADPSSDAPDSAAPPRGLLGPADGAATRLDRLHTLLHLARDHDAVAFAMRLRELGFLANVLVAGCPVQGRALTPAEAADAAASTCALALDRLAAAPDRFLVEHDLLALFEVGWTIVRERVCVRASKRLVEVLGQIRYHDPDTQKALVALRLDLKRHLRDRAPWRAAAALDVIAILDTPAWAALVGLVAECPVLHAAVPAICERRRTSIDPTAFEFFAERRQLAMVAEFLERLPAILAG